SRTNCHLSRQAPIDYPTCQDLDRTIGMLRCKGANDLKAMLPYRMADRDIFFYDVQSCLPGCLQSRLRPLISSLPVSMSAQIASLDIIS
ncbi:MAG: hypothetical protein AAFQ92_13440, partial [Bacteroidota bacterium]